MNKQAQQVASGGQAIQAGNNVTIGLGAEELKSILIEVASLEAFKREALAVVESRFEEFREDLAKAFQKPNNADFDALKDPDFQYMMGDAQESFARSGDPSVKDVLIDIVARRSKATTQTREAITLNSAAKVAANLTKDEFANLALVYLFRYTTRQNLNTTLDLAAYFNEAIIPLARSANPAESSTRHIEANSCGKNSAISGAHWREVLMHFYGGLIGKGLDLAEYEKMVPEERRHIIPSILADARLDPTKFQPRGPNKEIFERQFQACGLTAAELTSVWSSYQNTVPPENELVDLLRNNIPEIDVFVSKWNGLQGMELTNLGLAIGHANASLALKFDAPLSTWIK